jgi:hypothetical protein
VSGFLYLKEHNLNLEKYLVRQQDWSLKTFCPGIRDEGLIKHIEKELEEIRDSPGDVEEWGIEGALRNAKSVEDIEKVKEVIDCLQMKQGKNLARSWPDLTKSDLEQPIEHLKDGEPCRHPGCLSHRTHPCEGCGRIVGRAELK